MESLLSYTFVICLEASYINFLRIADEKSPMMPTTCYTRLQIENEKLEVIAMMQNQVRYSKIG